MVNFKVHGNQQGGGRKGDASATVSWCGWLISSGVGNSSRGQRTRKSMKSGNGLRRSLLGRSSRRVVMSRY
ncbi:unnamed protein product [Amoebophrya sp. A25]|nr:unnamed protein product [Amoebophrya sp. A25]|eukprot:GSA25T00021144001.1